MELRCSQIVRPCALWLFAATAGPFASAGCMMSTDAAEGEPNGDSVDTTQESIVVAGNCQTVTPDATQTQPGEEDGNMSGDYGHSLCPHTFVFDTNYPKAGPLDISFIGPPRVYDDTTFPCNAEWLRYKVLFEPSGFTAYEGTLYGENVGTTHNCAAPAATLQLTRGGYRVLATGGFITLYAGVEVDGYR